MNNKNNAKKDSGDKGFREKHQSLPTSDSKRKESDKDLIAPAFKKVAHGYSTNLKNKRSYSK